MRVGRRVRTIRVWWLLASFVCGYAFAVAEDLLPSWRDNQLFFTAPRLHFLSGKPLERLRNAAEVPFDFQITLWAGSRTRELRRTAARFVVSYDLWEEKFSVVKVSAPRKTAAHLTAQAAEAWTLEQMPLDAMGLGNTEPFWVRLDVRAQPARTNAPLFGRDSVSESGISLNGLVEIFSRPAQTDQPRWMIEVGPLTLNEIRRGRG
jgi:hypothetical protein